MSLVVLPAGSGSAWIVGEGCRYRDLTEPTAGPLHFTELSPSQTGIAFTYHVSDEKGAENSIRLGGTGIAAGDVDGDGWCDLFFCSMGGRSALYRNLGNWRFEDITAEAGVACEGQDSTGAAFADVDGDGDLDLLVNSIGGGTRLFLNDGQGHFTESVDCGLMRRYGSTSLALADIDGNGTLDLYVANFATTKIEDRPNTKIQVKTVNGVTVVSSLDGVPTTAPALTNRYFIDQSDHVIQERGEPDVLYLNDGHGKFTPVTWTDGTFLNEEGKPLAIPPYDWGLSVMFRDMNGDLAPDIYVCNDLFTPDRIWINDGHGRFRALSNLAVRQTSLFSMGIDFADINRDGYDDFVVVDMLGRELAERKVQTFGVKYGVPLVGKIDNRPQSKRNTLFLNRGDGTYAEISQFSGLEATGWSWCPIFLDVDLDGFEDLLVTAGYNRDALNADAIAHMKSIQGNRKLSDHEFRELKKLFPKLHQRNQAFRNRGDLTFEDKGHEWGFDYLGISQGVCLADLDNDGDLDVVVNRQEAPVGIYRNETLAPRVAVRLQGRPPNTRGIGAKIRFLGGPVPQSQEMICGGRYLSGDDNLRVFASGGATSGLSIEVTWRGGARSVVLDVRPNRLYEIDEGSAKPPAPVAQPESKPLFADVSELLHHQHTDEFFDDFARQPTLPRKLSQLGPGVAWQDIDGDGREDLIIGSGKGGQMGVYRNDGHGGFERVTEAPWSQPITRDQTAIIGWPRAPGQMVLLAGSANYEDGLRMGSCARQFDLTGKTIDESLPALESSTGPLAMADIDGDGDLDLFVGGRVVPGRYPQAASSVLFRNTGGKFEIDADNTRTLSSVGLVSGAVFSDLDGDGYAELILACEWGPLRVFHNDHGKFVEITEQLGLTKYRGWWNGVAAGDFDGDGRMDIVASNWGQNTKYETYRKFPLQISYSDLAGAGPLAVVLACYEPVLQKWVPFAGFSAMTKAMPWLSDHFNTHAAYSLASASELFGEHAGTLKTLEANWLESSIFLNRGDHFLARALPPEAQFSPAFGVSVADLDGDGFEDIFLAQNFFAVDHETSRYDAGRGLWLRGDGKGGFASSPGQESGIQIYGEQRGCALADYDGDGRVDLVVTQNGAATKLYHNAGAQPGLRVRLNAGPANPNGIGTALRLKFGQRFGPLREIHAGSGYWSQDGAVQVLAMPEPPTQIWIRWPGGRITQSDVPAHARSIDVDSAGLVNLVR